MNDREKLADTMIELKGYLEEIYEFPTLDCFLKELAMQLVAHGVTFQQWIPVTERLPEEKGFYLTARRRDVFVEQWNGVLFSERCHHAQPTHWMPLPEPPKG